MFVCSPAQRKCRHWYIKLIYFCYLPRLVECSPQVTYDLGAKILYFQCFVTTDMFLFSISIIPEDLESSRRDLAFGSVKTRFKAILKKSIFGLGFACGHLSWSFSNQNKLLYMLQGAFDHEKSFFHTPKA